MVQPSGTVFANYVLGNKLGKVFKVVQIRVSKLLLALRD